MTLPTPAPISTGGGGGGGTGGIAAETDPLLWFDEGPETYFLRSVEHDDTGAVTGVSLVDVDGAAYVPTGPVRPALDRVGGPDGTVAMTRLQNGSHNSAAGNVATHYVVTAAAVTVDGVAVPSPSAHTFEIRDRTIPAIAFVADGTGDVLIIEERA